MATENIVTLLNHFSSPFYSSYSVICLSLLHLLIDNRVITLIKEHYTQHYADNPEHYLHNPKHYLDNLKHYLHNPEHYLYNLKHYLHNPEHYLDNLKHYPDNPKHYVHFIEINPSFLFHQQPIYSIKQ